MTANSFFQFLERRFVNDCCFIGCRLLVVGSIGGRCWWIHGCHRSMRDCWWGFCIGRRLLLLSGPKSSRRNNLPLLSQIRWHLAVWMKTSNEQILYWSESHGRTRMMDNKWTTRLNCCFFRIASSHQFNNQNQTQKQTVYTSSTYVLYSLDIEWVLFVGDVGRGRFGHCR